MFVFSKLILHLLNKKNYQKYIISYDIDRYFNNAVETIQKHYYLHVVEIIIIIHRYIN
jgi:hypothetical protein